MAVVLLWFWLVLQVVVVLLCLILALAITCGILRLCKKEEHFAGEPTYSVAISNRLFKVKDDLKDLIFLEIAVF